jgi:hypothetical protein
VLGVAVLSGSSFGGDVRTRVIVLGVIGGPGRVAPAGRLVDTGRGSVRVRAGHRLGDRLDNVTISRVARGGRLAVEGSGFLERESVLGADAVTRGAT